MLSEPKQSPEEGPACRFGSTLISLVVTRLRAANDEEAGQASIDSEQASTPEARRNSALLSSHPTTTEARLPGQPMDYRQGQPCLAIKP